MHTLTATRTIPAPIDVVFEAFTDHEKLSQLPMVRSCKVTAPGATERNGLGAVRELDCGPIRLREQITAFERPHRMEYRIVDGRPPADHEFGTVDFAEAPAATKVTWTTRFGLRAPAGLGRVLDPLFGVGFGVVFRMVLRNVERRALAASR